MAVSVFPTFAPTTSPILRMRQHNKMKKLLGVSKFALACAGPALILFHIYLFKKYFSVATATPDETHTVAISNHGIDRYISFAQDQTLSITLGAAVVMLVVFFGMIILKLRENRG